MAHKTMQPRRKRQHGSRKPTLKVRLVGGDLEQLSIVGLEPRGEYRVSSFAPVG